MAHFLSSLRSRLLFLVALALVPAFGLAIGSANQQRQLVAAQTQQDALRLARTAAGDQEQLAESARQLLMVLAQIPAIRNPDASACHAFLSALLPDFPDFVGFRVIAPSGTVTCTSDDADDPTDFSDHYVFQRAVQTHRLATGEYRLLHDSNLGAIAFGYPLLGSTAQVQAVLLAIVDVRPLSRFTSGSLLPSGATVITLDRTGTILSHAPDADKWIGQSLTSTPLFRAIQTGQGEGTIQTAGQDGVERLYAYAPLRHVPDNDIYVSVGIPTGVAFAPVRQALAHNLIALAVVAALALAAAWAGSDVFLLRQVNALIDVTGRLADGDLSARTGLRYGVDELSRLARGLDRMVDKLEQYQHERIQAGDRFRRGSACLKELINVVAESIGRPTDAGPLPNITLARALPNIALARTLRELELTTGVILLKRGETLERVAAAGLDTPQETLTATLQPIDDPTGEIEELLVCGTVADIPPATLTAILGPAARRFPGWVSVPVISKGRIFGIMCLAYGEGQLAGTQEREVLAAAGQQIGVAIENADLYAQVQSVAALKERERLSRELHDGLAQVLGYLCLKNKSAIALAVAGDMDRTQVELQEIQTALQGAYQDLRESVLGLRTGLTANGDLVAVLDEYTHKFGVQTQIAVEFNAAGNGWASVNPEIQVQILRIVQEALSNVRKHSQARQASLRLESREKDATVTISDNGRGFDPLDVDRDGTAHFGLQTMRERAEGVGGTLEISSQPGQGTRIVARFALVSEEDR